VYQEQKHTICFGEIRECYLLECRRNIQNISNDRIGSRTRRIVNFRRGECSINEIGDEEGKARSAIHYNRWSCHGDKRVVFNPSKPFNMNDIWESVPWILLLFLDVITLGGIKGVRRGQYVGTNDKDIKFPPAESCLVIS
jgi:hypothetical protein